MKLKILAKALIRHLPGNEKLFPMHTGGTNTARYCYSVWLRHLVLANEFENDHPKIVAELGPGDSLGMGIAALISGAEYYYALDVVKYWDIETNLKIFDELVEMFRNKESIPGKEEFAKLKPAMVTYDFPSHIYTDTYLKKILDPERLKKIRESIARLGNEPLPVDNKIKYFIPWYESNVIEEKSVDMIFSQSVLEHVNEVENTYLAMDQWLRPGGIISHSIDFKSHGTADLWNGHWAHSDFAWKVIKGNKSFLLNREPYSTHETIIRKLGFKIIREIKVKMKSELSRQKLAKRFNELSDEDLSTSSAFVQGVKPA